MKLVQILTLGIFTIGCATRDTGKGLFKDLVEKKEVTIILKNYGLDSIPKDIAQLKKAETLTISLDSIKGWTVYPPLSAMDNRIDSPPFKILPDEITKLKNLKRLAIYKLDIHNLPDNFSNLENLEYLDLSMNKLIVSNELSKLKALKHLKYLGLFGNRIDTLTIVNWRKENAGLQIDCGIK